MAPVSSSFKWPHSPIFPRGIQLVMVPCIYSHLDFHGKKKEVFNLVHSLWSVIGIAYLGTCWGAFKMNYWGKKFSIRGKLISIEPAGSSHKILKGGNCAVLNKEGRILLIPGSWWQRVNDDKFHYCECQYKGWWESLL